MKILQRFFVYFSSPVLLHFVLPVLMVYLIAGTVSQKYIGLYDATQIFFSSVILWAGPLPLPGLPVFMALIFLNLSFKLIFKSPWHIRNAGIIITHIGALLLLLGGMFTALFSSEGYIDLAVGQSKSHVMDYHSREFVISTVEGEVVHRFAHQDLTVGDVLHIPSLPFHIRVLETCRHCDIQKREDAQDHYVGMAQHMVLSSGELFVNDEENMAGLTFEVGGIDDRSAHVVLENVPQYPQVSLGGKTYQFVLRKEKRALPFEITLLDFKREMYPGTATAKSYQSRVLIQDGDAQWESLISMNEPLRYKGYTFFQASFIETENGDISVLAAVWNVGRAFPYISGIVMCLGLIIHLFVRKRKMTAGRVVETV